MPRVYAFSDLHVDHPENMATMERLSNQEYVNDVLIVAGDVTDSLDRLDRLFDILLPKFSCIFFVPGNHELWIRNNNFAHSIEKFEAILSLCEKAGVKTSPTKLTGTAGNLWLVPLFSWYRLPEKGAQTLYIEKLSEVYNPRIWMDNSLCRWPSDTFSPADYFFSLNRDSLAASYDAPVISFSHFLPRRDLMFESLHLAKLLGDGMTPIAAHPLDMHPQFNFSRVAGDQLIEHQIRQLGSVIHVYGHQHRNRDRVIDGVQYISHCLGSIHERKFLAPQGDKPKPIAEY